MNTIKKDNYVKIAEKAISELANKKNARTGRPISMVTTSQIRNLLAMTADIYNEVERKQGDTLTEDIVSRIQYLRLRFVYEAGRNPKVKDLVMQAKLLDVLDEIGDSKENYILFSHYMEALVAYRKFYAKDED